MSPFFLLTILIGGIYGAIFQVWQGKTVRDVFFYVLAGTIGFSLGQMVGSALGWQYGMIGPLFLIEGTFICWITLLATRWLRM
ncbi:MAG: hypothetical protein AAF629_15625 [Chloroflexota bacterium]